MNSQQKCVLVFLIGAIVSITNGIVAVANVLPDFSGYTQGAPNSDCGNFAGPISSGYSNLYGSSVESSLIKRCIDECSAKNDICQGVGVLVSMNDQIISPGTYRTFCNKVWAGDGVRYCTVSKGGGGVSTQFGNVTYYSNDNFIGKAAPPPPALTCSNGGTPCSNPTPVCNNGICKACTSDAQCPYGQICENGSCIDPHCKSNADCSNPTPICDTGRCRACSSDPECGPGNKCVTGSCEAKKLTLCP